jgi:glutamate decarboxylase
VPPERQDLAVQRVLVRHGFSRDLARTLLADYRQAISHFGRHPVTTPLSEQEGGGFRHG